MRLYKKKLVRGAQTAANMIQPDIFYALDASPANDASDFISKVVQMRAVYIQVTQEEVGLRGAQTAANMIQPDIFYALDASPANDASGDKTQFGQLGKGALLRIYDRTMVTHRGMREFILDTAETHNIPYQYFISQGGTDAGRVHTSNSGIPSAVIGVCARYIHTHASILHVDDYAAAKS